MSSLELHSGSGVVGSLKFLGRVAAFECTIALSYGVTRWTNRTREAAQ